MAQLRGRRGRGTFAVARVVGAVVAADGGGRHVELLVLVALPHRNPHPRVVRPQLRTSAYNISDCLNSTSQSCLPLEPPKGKNIGRSCATSHPHNPSSVTVRCMGMT